MANPGEQSLLELHLNDVRNAKSSWNSGLGDVCNDPGTCCLGLMCLPCLFGRNYSQLQGGRGCCAACCMYSFCPCLACYFASDVRRHIRDKYNLLPEPCNDFAVHCLCSPCATCQESREMSYYEQPGSRVARPQ
ncbi:hypothetical protein PLESTB_001664800 [Pleodorina starrii]|uniref:Uncharacterized protein n=1 Tax=Pleodorina starrii TaxID=330485 RepID=A0A9W6F8V3_9CHLO|nr:hypothetical protein PLESTB_001664800 [Pleodorina starrii]GLC69901.1 hypothetical protein PLESTF_000893700 [Pleodorina starrii]